MSNSFASLHAGLVARKGEATPAVSHSAFTYVDAPRQETRPEQVPPTPVVTRSAPIDAKQKVSRPSVAPRVQKKTTAPQKATRQTAKYRLTFRMTHEQRRRMRIAMAQTDLSLQHILSDALDNYLDGLCACSLSECACMARDDKA